MPNGCLEKLLHPDSYVLDLAERLNITIDVALALEYLHHEYGLEGNVSTNGDVYNYMILLLEMFTKKKLTDDMFNGEMSLKDWVDRALQENT
ncbi:hypothetical protein ACS0TY_028229 [Phlomoides rotata]